MPELLISFCMVTACPLMKSTKIKQAAGSEPPKLLPLLPGLLTAPHVNIHTGAGGQTVKDSHPDADITTACQAGVEPLPQGGGGRIV